MFSLPIFNEDPFFFQKTNFAQIWMNISQDYLIQNAHQIKKKQRIQTIRPQALSKHIQQIRPVLSKKFYSSFLGIIRYQPPSNFSRTNKPITMLSLAKTVTIWTIFVLTLLDIRLAGASSFFIDPSTNQTLALLDMIAIFNCPLDLVNTLYSSKKRNLQTQSNTTSIGNVYKLDLSQCVTSYSFISLFQYNGEMQKIEQDKSFLSGQENLFSVTEDADQQLQIIFDLEQNKQNGQVIYLLQIFNNTSDSQYSYIEQQDYQTLLTNQSDFLSQISYYALQVNITDDEIIFNGNQSNLQYYSVSNSTTKTILQEYNGTTANSSKLQVEISTSWLSQSKAKIKIINNSSQIQLYNVTIKYGDLLYSQIYLLIFGQAYQQLIINLGIYSASSLLKMQITGLISNLSSSSSIKNLSSVSNQSSSTGSDTNDQTSKQTANVTNNSTQQQTSNSTEASSSSETTIKSLSFLYYVVGGVAAIGLTSAAISYRYKKWRKSLDEAKMEQKTKKIAEDVCKQQQLIKRKTSTNSNCSTQTSIPASNDDEPIGTQTSFPDSMPDQKVEELPSFKYQRKQSGQYVERPIHAGHKKSDSSVPVMQQKRQD